MNAKEKFELYEFDSPGNTVFSRTFEDHDVAERIARILCAEEYHGRITIVSTTTGEIYEEYSPWYELDELELSVRSRSILVRSGITTKEQLLGLSVNDLRQMRNMGSKGIAEIMRKIADLVDPCNHETTL